MLVQKVDFDIGLANPLLFKEKPKLRGEVLTSTPNESFGAFAKRFLGDSVLHDSISTDKALDCLSGFPLLRAQLLANTTNRIRLVFFYLFGLKFAASINKEELVRRCLKSIDDLVVGIEKGDIAQRVADFGVFKEDGGLFLLQENSIDNMGGKCVAEMESLIGWMVIDGKFERKEVETRNLKWGELYLHKKVSLKD